MVGGTQVTSSNTGTKKTGTNTEADSKSVNQTGPTDSFPSSSGAPGLALSSDTERRRGKSGERKREKEGEEEEKTGHRCEACRTQAHGRDEKTIHTHTQRNRLEHWWWPWCEWTRLGGWIRPHLLRPVCCVSQQLSETTTSTLIFSQNCSKASLPPHLFTSGCRLNRCGETVETWRQG